MKRLLIATLATAIAAPTLAQTTLKLPSATEVAQHQVKMLTTLLSLTSAQQQQAKTIYLGAAQAEETARASEKTARDALRAAIKNNDISTIDQVSSSLAETMAQSTAIHAKADAAFYQILTGEQQSKLSELENQHIGPFGGPGVPGAPPAVGLR